MKTNTPSEFASAIQEIGDLPCWAVTAGKGAGTRVLLDFGKKTLRDKPLSNPHVSKSSQKYEGAYTLFIKDCSWRLDSANKVLCSSRSDSNLEESKMLVGLDKIVGKKILAIKLSSPAYDLILHFQGKFSLHLFADCVETEPDQDNYVFFAPQWAYVVKSNGHVAKEKRA